VHVKRAGLTGKQARRAPLPGSPLTAISQPRRNRVQEFGVLRT
jgi:hypothetical protein